MIDFSVASILFAVAFLLILIVLHFLKPEFAPSWRMISEYAIGKHGWLMRVAFVSWSLSVACMLVVLWPILNSGNEFVGRIWFITIAVSLIGASIFRTNPITDPNATVSHTIHLYCGTIVIVTFPIAATILNNFLYVVQGIKNPLYLEFGTILCWFGLASFIGTIVIARIRNPKVGDDGTKLYMGWPNRFLVLTYLVWNITAVASVS